MNPEFVLCLHHENEEPPAHTNTIRAGARQDMLPLAAVVLYDDYESGCRAKAFLDDIAADAGGAIQFRLALWRIDSLAHPDTSTGVFRDLEGSTILALALRAGGDLPKSVVACVECWAHCRSGDDSALVVLGNAGPTAVEELGQIAQLRGITLFCKQTTPAGSERDANIEGPEKPEQFSTAILETIPHDSRIGYYRHWGLNE